MICKNCGNMMPDGVRFCSKCGQPVANMPGGQGASGGQHPVPEKKKGGAMIALVVVLVVLAIAAVVLAVVFFQGLSGSGKDSGDHRSAVEEEERRDDEENDDTDDADADDPKGEEADEEESDDGKEDRASEEKPEAKDSPSKNNNDDPFKKSKDKNRDSDEEQTAREDVDALFSGNQEDYILPDSSTRRLTSRDLEEIADDKELLRIARNEIYARHHRLFQDEKLQSYFDSKEWYDGYIEPDDFSEDMLSRIERDNLNLIKEFEAKL